MERMNRYDALLQHISGSIGLMNSSPFRDTVLEWWRAVSPELKKDALDLAQKDGYATIAIFGRWLDFMRKLGRDPIGADVDHSALLKRMLDGKDPLPTAPPLMNSYPCYTLGEGLPYLIYDVWECDVPTLGPRVIIEGHHDWVRVDSDSLELLKHVPTGDLYSLKDKILQKVTE